MVRKKRVPGGEVVKMWRGRGRHLALLLVAATVLLGACGGSGAGTTEVASVRDGDGRGDGGGGRRQEGEKDPEKALLAFARCMREHGVDMPDPEPVGEGMVRFEARPGEGKMPDESAFRKADDACRHLMGGAAPRELSPDDRQAMQDAMVAFARCMREHGIDMPDPEPGGGGIRARVGEGPDPRAPAFRAAEKECRKHTEAMEKRLGIERREG